MSEKRKDNKGRLLRTGESQRKDLTYMYRYKDNDGTRRCVYAPTLAELRVKEDDITTRLNHGLVIGDKLTVIELVDMYLRTRTDLEESTKESYHSAYKRLSNAEFAKLPVKDVSRTSVKMFYLDLNEAGIRYGSIQGIANLLRPAFQMAVDDDRLLKNPCTFRLGDIIKNDAKKRQPLAEDELVEFLKFVHTSKKHRQYYNQVAILAYTGMRVSEMCALTVNDIDFKAGLINVNKQIADAGDKKRYVKPPKSDSGNRLIAIAPQLVPILKDAIREAMLRKTQPISDGVSGFLFVTKHGLLCRAEDVGTHFRQMMRAYNATREESAPKITPHILRHTFCTKCIQDGVDVKSVQYLMGHSTANITMNVYAHTNSVAAAKAFRKVYGA